MRVDAVGGVDVVVVEFVDQVVSLRLGEARLVLGRDPPPGIVLELHEVLTGGETGDGKRG